MLFSALAYVVKRESNIPTLPWASEPRGRGGLRSQSLYLSLFLSEIPNTDLGIQMGSGRRK